MALHSFFSRSYLVYFAICRVGLSGWFLAEVGRRSLILSGVPSVGGACAGCFGLVWGGQGFGRLWHPSRHCDYCLYRWGVGLFVVGLWGLVLSGVAVLSLLPGLVAALGFVPCFLGWWLADHQCLGSSVLLQYRSSIILFFQNTFFGLDCLRHRGLSDFF